MRLDTDAPIKLATIGDLQIAKLIFKLPAYLGLRYWLFREDLA